MVSDFNELTLMMADQLTQFNSISVIIDDLADDMERTDMRINSETRHVGVVTQKDSTWGYWLTIIILFVAIVIIAFL